MYNGTQCKKSFTNNIYSAWNETAKKKKRNLKLLPALKMEAPFNISTQQNIRWSFGIEICRKKLCNSEKKQQDKNNHVKYTVFFHWTNSTFYQHLWISFFTLSSAQLNVCFQIKICQKVECRHIIWYCWRLEHYHGSVVQNDKVTVVYRNKSFHSWICSCWNSFC